MLGAASAGSLGRAVPAGKGQTSQHPGPKTLTATNGSARLPSSPEHLWGRNLEAQPCREQLLAKICLWTEKWGFVFLNRKPGLLSFLRNSKAAD